MGRARRGRGEGGVREHPSGHWEATISLGYSEDGKRRRKTVTGKTKGEVQEKLRALQGQGPIGDAGSLTLVEYLRRYVAQAKGRLQSSTHERYDELVRLHLTPAIGMLKLAKLSPIAVEGFYRSMADAGASAHTIRAANAVLSKSLKEAVRLKLVTSNPCVGVAMPKAKRREPSFLTACQARHFLDAVRNRPDFALYCVALGAGLRLGEVLALRWGDYDAKLGAVSVRRSLTRTKDGWVFKEPKSAAGKRTVLLPAFARAALDARRREGGRTGGGDLIFATRTGAPVHKSNFTKRSFRPALKRCAKLCEAAGVDAPPAALRFHDLRHTHASVLVSSGLSLKAISQRLGHASVELTLRVYSHVMPTDDAQLAGATESLFGGLEGGSGTIGGN